MQIFSGLAISLNESATLAINSLKACASIRSYKSCFRSNIVKDVHNILKRNFFDAARIPRDTWKQYWTPP